MGLARSSSRRRLAGAEVARCPAERLGLPARRQQLAPRLPAHAAGGPELDRQHPS